MWRSGKVSRGAKREGNGFRLASPRACKEWLHGLVKRPSPEEKRSIGFGQPSHRHWKTWGGMRNNPRNRQGSKKNPPSHSPSNRMSDKGCVIQGKIHLHNKKGIFDWVAEDTHYVKFFQ
jgi:hypothetical protein